MAIVFLPIMDKDLQDDHATIDAVVSERQIRYGMRINILAGSLGMVWVAAAIGIPLTMYMEKLGASGAMIGLTSTVQQLAMLLQVPSALLAERLSTRKRFWGTFALAHRALWFVPAFLPLLISSDPRRMAQLVVVVVAISSVLANIGAAAWWSWMADLIPERLRGSFWGRRQSVVTLAHLGAVFLVGWLLDVFSDTQLGGSYFGFVLVFSMAAVLGCADILVHLRVPEPPPVRGPGGRGLLEQVLAPLRNRDFLLATTSLSIWTFGIGLVGQFGILYLRREFGATYTQISATAISASLGVVLFGMAWGYVMDRLGPRNLGALAMLIAPMFGIVWFFAHAGPVSIPIPLLPGGVTVPQPIAILMVMNLFAGAIYSAVGLAQVGLIATIAPQGGRTMAMAVHWSLVGLMAALGPVAGGLVMDWIVAHPPEWVLPTGTRFAFFHVLLIMHMGVTWAFAVPLLLSVRRRPGEVHFRTAFERLFVGNPLRAASGIYNVWAMNVALSSRKHAEALRKVGSGRTAIAVSDLIAGLDDPVQDVREEAAMALGRIGTPEAVDALLQTLNDPHVDIIPKIVRALASTGDRKVTPSIVTRLSDSDRETVSEAARALGELGDRSASRALLDVLAGSDDAIVVSAASEALSRLGVMAALYEIVPRMSATQNRVLKRSLAVAAGDLLGPPGDYYRSYRREQRSPGSEVERLLSQLGEKVRRTASTHMQEQGDVLIHRITQTQSAYDHSDYAECMRLLRGLAIGLAALHYGVEFGGDTDVFVESLIWHDERIGLGVWHLDLVVRSIEAGTWTADALDVLLSLHCLSQWS
jgi:MFS family permease